MPGMASLLSISLLARAAITADVMALTMYVVPGCPAAGLAGLVATIHITWIPLGSRSGQGEVAVG